MDRREDIRGTENAGTVTNFIMLATLWHENQNADFCSKRNMAVANLYACVITLTDKDIAK